MSSFFQALGFPVRTMDDLRDLGERVVREGERVGGMVRWARGPIELWAEAQDGRARFVLPFFAGEDRHGLGVVATGDLDEEPEDAWIEAWLDPAEDDEPFSGRFPLVCNLVNLALVRERLARLPATLSVTLAAFAHEVSVYEDALTYELERPPASPFPARSFVSVHHARVDMEEVMPDPTAIVTGVVDAAEELTNEATGMPYMHVRLATLGATVDCLATRDQIAPLPQPGNVVQGTWWIVARAL